MNTPRSNVFAVLSVRDFGDRKHMLLGQIRRILHEQSGSLRDVVSAVRKPS